MAITTDQQERFRWAVIGGGNGGQSLSGHLAIMGFPVRLYDIIPETIEAINTQGGVEVDGAVEGFGKLELATMNLAEAIDGADIIMVVAPALAHRKIAKECVPHLQDGQVVFIHPGATGGALEFSKVLKMSAVRQTSQSQKRIHCCMPAGAHNLVMLRSSALKTSLWCLRFRQLTTKVC